MTDRLIRIGSGTFCQVQHLQPGDVIKLFDKEYTVERLLISANGDVRLMTTDGWYPWTLKVSQDVTVVKAGE